MSVPPGEIEIETCETQANQYRIHARRVRPPDPPRATVVVVHGMVLAGRGTMPLARALARRRLEVHMPDLPGFGRSEKPNRALDVPGLARAVSDWIKRKDLGRVILLGNSFGTQVAAGAAVRAADVSGLVLVAPTIDARFRGRWAARLPPGRPPGSTDHLLLRSLHRRLADRLVPDEPEPGRRRLGQLVVSEYVAAGPARAVSTYRHALRDDLARTVAGVDVPVVVIRGGADRLASREWVETVASAASLSTTIEVPGMGHDGQFRQPDKLADAILGALPDRPGSS